MSDKDLVPSDGLEQEVFPPAKMPEFQYSRELLMRLKNSPASLKRPAFLDDPYYGNILRGSDDGRIPKGTGPGKLELEKMQRRPTERLRTEEDFGLLSPQRKTWGAGCHVEKASLPDKGGAGGLVKRGLDELDREPPLQPRRLGPQRSLNPEKGDRSFYSARDRERESLPRDKYDRSEHCDRDRGEREPFNKDRRERGDFERGNPRAEAVRDTRDYRNGTRGDHRDNTGRGMNDVRDRPQRGPRDPWGRPQRFEEEPEWMSAGPTSKYDTIELKGFENPRAKKDKVEDKKGDKKEPEKVEIADSKPTVSKPTESPAPVSKPNPDSFPGSKLDAHKPPESPKPGLELGKEEKGDSGLGFSLDEFNMLFMMDSLPDVPLGDFLEDFSAGGDEGKEGSKFSKFFSAEKSFTESSLHASIFGSKSDSAEKHVEKSKDPNQVLSDFLKSAQSRSDVPPPPVPGTAKVPAKALRLEDLEGSVTSQKKEKSGAGMDAFKKLLAQVESKGLTNGALPNQHVRPLPKTAMTEEQFLSTVMGGQKTGPPPSPATTSHLSVFPGLLANQNAVAARSPVPMNPHIQPLHGMMNKPPPVVPEQFGMPPSFQPHLQNPEAQVLLKALSSGRLSTHDLLKHLSDPRFDKHLAGISEQVLRRVAPEELAMFKRNQYASATQGMGYPPPAMPQQRPSAPAQTKSMYSDIPLSVIKRMTANKEAESNKGKSEGETAPGDVSSVSAKPKIPSKLTGRTVSQLPKQAEKPPVKEPEKPTQMQNLFGPQSRQSFPSQRPDYGPPMHPGYGQDPRNQQSYGRGQSPEGLLQQLMGGSMQQQQRSAQPQYVPHNQGSAPGYPDAYQMQAKFRSEHLQMTNEGLLSQMMSGARGQQPHGNNYFNQSMSNPSTFRTSLFESLENTMQK